MVGGRLTELRPPASTPGDGELTASLKEEFEYENADAAEKKTFEAYQENRSAIESLGFKVRLPPSWLACGDGRLGGLDEAASSPAVAQRLAGGEGHQVRHH